MNNSIQKARITVLTNDKVGLRPCN